MDYSEITRRVRMLDFIRNDQTADAAVKTVLDSLVHRLNDEQAHTLADKFPGQLALESFGCEDKKMETLSIADYIAGISTQFKISVYQARTLVRNVLYFTKEAFGTGMVLDLRCMPADWAEAIQSA